jgi:hypothetical protein
MKTIVRRTGLALALLATACASSGGGGGGDIADGPLFWGIPFVPADSTESTMVGLRNNDTDGTTVTLQGYKPDGTTYSAPVAISLDGLDESRFGIGSILGGSLPEGGWISVSTPSGKVEVYSSTIIPGKTAEEAMRAFPAPDPLPSPFLVGITATTETDTIQISNTTGVAIVVAVTAYEEPAGDPLLPPDASTPLPVALAPFETKLFTPDGLAEISGFVGAFQLSSASPFLAAAREDLGYDVGRAQVLLETRLVATSLNFGRQLAGPFGFENFWDFAVVARNDRDTPQTFTVTQFADQNGPLITSPRTILLDAFESRVVTAFDPEFSDLLAPPLTTGFLQLLWIEASVPEGVDVTFRQFGPVAFDFNMTQRPVRLGHLFVGMDVLPQPVVGLGIRSVVSLVNPNGVAITVQPEALISEPEDFDGTAILLPAVTIPPRTRVDWTPDGVVYVDRDGEPVDSIGLRFFSLSPYYVTGWRERRTGADGLILSVTPMIVRNLDEEDD